MTKILTVVPKLPHMIARESVIDTLEALLKRAYSGELQAISYAVLTDREAQWGWSECQNDVLMQGAIANLGYKFSQD